jgi:hypothetical protein
MTIIYIQWANKGIDAPPNSSRDPKVGLRMKQRKKKKLEAHFLIHNISGVKRRVGALGWD